MAEDLRAHIVEAMRGHYPIAARIDGTVVCHCGATVQADPDRVGIREHRADAVMALVQPELDRLTAELHRHAACASCGHERHRHSYEPIIRRDWCTDCPTANDLHTFQQESP